MTFIKDTPLPLDEAITRVGITQTELAECTGLSIATINLICNGKTTPRETTKKKIENFIKYKIDWTTTRLQRTSINEDLCVGKAEHEIATALSKYLAIPKRNRSQQREFIFTILNNFWE